MEDNKHFVDETDYKALFEYKCKETEDVKKLAADRLDQIETLEMKLAAAERDLYDAEDKTERMNALIERLRGEVNAYQYCIRYYMVGEG